MDPSPVFPTRPMLAQAASSAPLRHPTPDGRCRGRMIDSSSSAPKEDPRNVSRARTPEPTIARSRASPIASAALALGLALGLLACAQRGEPVQAPTPQLPGKPSASAEESAPSASGEGREETPAESEGASEETKDERDDERPRRIVLRTVYDDREVGDEQSRLIEAELGLVQDEALESYVRSIALRLLRHAPPRPFEYEFKIIDQTVPNAFALPGGKIYVSRGLLALATSEDELAGVLGHEITHAVERHAAGRIEHASRLNPFIIGLMRAAEIAEYSRDQERDADRGGQILAAQAGYDPVGIATFMRKLDAAERYETGWSRLPFFLATHPTSPERAALATNRAEQLEWTRVEGVADDKEHASFGLTEGEPHGYYAMIDGLILGENPAGGLFHDTLFVHPDLRFSIRFPRGWKTMNSPQAVTAVSPRRDAQATLSLEGKGGDLEKIVDDFLAEERDGVSIRVDDRRRVRIGELEGIRIEGRASNGMTRLWTQITFLEYDGLVYNLSTVSLAGGANRYRGRARAFAYSFRPLDEAEAHSEEVTRLRVARALENETLQQLSGRTGNALEVVFTGVMNDLFATTPLSRGMLVKIGLREPYIPEAREEEPAASEDADPGAGGKDASLGERSESPQTTEGAAP
jgi:predicted Zn-dependent protease